MSQVRTAHTPIPARRPAAPPTWISVYVPVGAAIVLRLASESTADASYLVLAAYAFFGRASLIRALALSWFFTMISSGIAPDANMAVVGRYVVLFAAAVSAMIYSGFGIRHLKVQPFTMLTVVLGLAIIAHAFFFSPMLTVSVLKAASWTLAMATSVSAWCGLSDRQREALSRQLFGGLIAILVVSVPLAASSLGFLRNGSGFQGILNHPQVFGPTMALLGAWAMARVLGETRAPWWLLGVAGAAFAGTLMSEARTAGLAVMLAVGLSVLFGPGLSGQSIGRMVPGLRSARVWAVIFAASLAGVAMAPTIASTVEHFITKSGRVEATGLLDAYDRSRGRLMDRMLENISARPVTGIGFGIASDPMTMEVTRDPVLGLPIGAAIEKGVVPLMVLEELGVFGAIFVGFWTFRLLRGSARGGLGPMAVCLTGLLLNMAEATLFSPGGFGLLLLVLFGWAYASGQAKARPADV